MRGWITAGGRGEGFFSRRPDEMIQHEIEAQKKDKLLYPSCMKPNIGINPGPLAYPSRIQVTTFLLLAGQDFAFVLKGNSRGLRPGKRAKLPFAGCGKHFSGRIGIGSTEVYISFCPSCWGFKLINVHLEKEVKM